ncbi:hypothetical protein INR49_016629 [Caranx melampygus]|nr:hypothetical protein INR49_016629 [Caranx melampygus]
MTLDMIESRFWAITAQDIDCFVIDNNGFILISKQRSHAGRFYGEIDGSVMTTLIRMGMFKRVSLYDYQAMCKMNPHSVSSSRPLLSPFYGLASALKWFLSNFLLMFVVQQIPESNLLMLVVQADCDCSRQYGPLTMQPREVRYILQCFGIN